MTRRAELAVLMVCMGNICRSPTAEAVLRHKLVSAGLGERVRVDSTGTHAWHEGEPPDPRSVRHAARRGYDLSRIRSRPIAEADLERVDLILAIDWDNLGGLEAQCPEPRRRRLGHLCEHARRFDMPWVPDPYSGGAGDFEQVLDLVEDACDGLVEHLRARLARGAPGTS